MNVKEHVAALKKLGKHETGVGCLYINKLEDVDMNVLKGIIDASFEHTLAKRKIPGEHNFLAGFYDNNSRFFRNFEQRYE